MIKASESRNEIRVVTMTLPPITQQQSAIANGTSSKRRSLNEVENRT